MGITEHQKQEIAKAKQVLLDGGIILYPTDTVWGIGCDATNEVAVHKIFEIKQRSDSQSLIVLVPNEGMLSRYVKEVPDIAWELLDAATSPTTVVYPGAKGLSKSAIAKDGTIGIRTVKEGFVHRLAYNFGKPLISTSANISGQPTPLSFAEISKEIKNKVDYVLNLPEFHQTKAKPSSIIKLGLNGDVKILRP